MSFGIYILTYPGDFHLSTALVNSLKYFAPDIPRMIIPGDGFDHSNHPFRDSEVMRDPGGFWSEMQHTDRKFWAFAGPFSRFLYLDADVLCIGRFDELLKKIEAERDGFLYVTMHDVFDRSDWTEADRREVAAINKERIETGQLGNPALLRRFDPSYDYESSYAFNSGVFASSTATISESEFKQFYDREKEFFRRDLGHEFTWKDWSLFFGDQGRLNYLAHTKKIPVKSMGLKCRYLWGGSRLELSVAECLAGRAPHAFIHWAGCPRPSGTLFNTGLGFWLFAYGFRPHLEYGWQTWEVPGFRLWRHFSDFGVVRAMKSKNYQREFRQMVTALRRGIKQLTASADSV